MFRGKKLRELFKSKRWEELLSLSFMKSRLFGPTLQFQSSFRCLTLMLSCFSSCVMCFLMCFFQDKIKKCCAISWFSFFFFFLEACLNELMTSATQTICIWRVLFQNEICAVWKKRDAYTGRMIDSSNLKADCGGTFWRVVSNLCPCLHFHWLNQYSNNTGWSWT